MSTDIVTIAVFALLALALAGLALFAARARAAADQADRLDQDLASARAGLEAARTEARDALQARAAAETRLEGAQKAAGEAGAARDEAQRLRDEMRERLSAAEKQVALALQQAAEARSRVEDWEKTRRELREEAESSSMKALREATTRLLEDHGRATEAQRKENEERVRKATEALTLEFTAISQSVRSLNDQVAHNRANMDTVLRALSSPGGAAHYAEIGLENVLKQFGLERDRDFVLQYSVPGAHDGERLRPDAVVFMPGEAVLVIDCKASKHLLDLAEAEETEGEEAAYASLARTMNQHLKSLTAKDYRSAVADYLKRGGRPGQVGRMLTVMYLPNEGAVEKLARADGQFLQRAAHEQVNVAGPYGLASLIGVARVHIDLGRQAENQQHIVESAEKLLDGVATALGHADRIGKGLQGAAKAYTDFTRSVNSRLLPRARALTQAGLRPAKAKDLEKHLPGIEVRQLEYGELIDAEAEEVDQPATIEGPAE